MALLTQANIQALQTSLHKNFRAGYRDTSTIVDMVATTMSSSAALETYGWMRRIPKMREWIGPRVLNNLETHSYQLVNRDFELSVGVSRNDIEDDKLGVYAPLFEEMGRQSAYLPMDLLLETIAANPVGFDGVAFFNASHPLDPAGVQTNTSNETFGPDTWNAVRARMQGYTGEDGRPLGVNPNLVLIPPAYERMAKHIFGAPLAANGGTNVQSGEARYIVVPEWAGTNQWYALDTRAAIKPFLRQNRRPVEFVSMTQPNDEGVFTQRELRWGADTRMAMGVTLWWLAHRATGAVEAVTQLPAA